MKYLNKLILTFLFVICNYFNGFSQYTYELIGKIPSQYNHTTIYLKVRDHYSSSKYEKTDSVLINNNKFTFNGIIKKESELAYLYTKDHPINFYLQILIDSGENLMNIENGLGDDYYQNKLQKVKIFSSKTNDLLQQFETLHNKFFKLYGFRNPNDSTVNRLPDERENELKLEKIKLIQQNPDNFYGLIFLRNLLNFNGEEFNVLGAFQTLSENLKEKVLGVELNEELAKKIKSITDVKIGNVVPNFSVLTFERANFKNSSLRGTPYILVFSATWCIPCQKQLPLLIQLYRKYKDKGLKIVYFNLDDNIKIWEKHIQKNGLTWINVSERTKFKDSDIAKQFHIYAIPSSFVIDKKGNIVYNSDTMDIEMKELENYIKKVL